MTDASPDLLESAILRTVAYFDVFSYPITPEEVWRWLYRESGAAWQVDRSSVRIGLDQLVTAQRLERQDTWYFFPGRSEIVAIRQARQKENEKKWKRAKSTARFLEVVPYLKLVAVVNTLAIDNARPESDIDFLIITQPGRIWIARLMVTGLVEMLGYRRQGDKISNRICLSFYVTDDAMEMKKFAYADDHHLAFWTTQAVPMMDDGTYLKYADANRVWTSRLPNAWTWPWESRPLKPNKLLRGIKNFYGRIFGTAAGGYLEAWARDFQMQRMEKNINSRAKEGTTDVIISEEALKFHEADRRTEYNAAYVERCRRLGIAP